MLLILAIIILLLYFSLHFKRLYDVANDIVMKLAEKLITLAELSEIKKYYFIFELASAAFIVLLDKIAGYAANTNNVQTV